MACPNLASAQWKALVNKIGVFEAFREFVRNNEEIPNADNFEETFQGVNVTMKVVAALQQMPRASYPSNQIQGFYNDLIKFGTPKSQIELLKAHIEEKGITEIKTIDLITSLLSEMSYTVEINTTKMQQEDEIEMDESDYEMLDLGIDTRMYKKPTFFEANSDYYSNMTSPGGVNYTENELAIPEIIPSIKGHAQFSTDNGIGWFRADEQVLNGTFYKGGVFEGERISSSTEGGVLNPVKTRRILEVQSEVFQKGRDKERLTGDYRANSHVGEDVVYNGKLYIIGNVYEKGDFKVYDLFAENEEDVIGVKFTELKPVTDLTLKNDNNFLQLLNKDNNWVTFFIKSIIQDSAKKGYEKVLFPSGNTAAKIEGHQTLNGFIKQKEETLQKIGNPWWAVNKNGAGIFNSEDKDTVEKYAEERGYDVIRGYDLRANENVISQLNREIEDAKAGKLKVSAIAKFYEETIFNVLKKQKYFPERITDEFGNEWYEVTLIDKPEIADSTILFGIENSNEEELEFHINTIGVVSKFLENIGVEQELVPEFLNANGGVVEGAVAAANFLKGTVQIIDDVNLRPSAWNKLPEEAAHWWYRLLDKNAPLKDLLLQADKATKEEFELRNTAYGEAYEGPKVLSKIDLSRPGKYALSPMREEAIGQLIAKAIKRIETRNAAPEDYSFFKKFLEWINSILDIFKSTEQDPFEVAAMKILSSDMTDLMSIEEYNKLNNIVNFTDKVAIETVAPIDYALISDLGEPGYYTMEGITGFYFVGYGSPNSPVFDTVEDLDAWVRINFPEHDQRQQRAIREVVDNKAFFDRLLNKTFRKRTRYLPKTFKNFFSVYSQSGRIASLDSWRPIENRSEFTKNLTKDEKDRIKSLNNYTNIPATLKVLPDILKKYKKIPISLTEVFKIDGAKKQELDILNNIKELIKAENPTLKTISAENFVSEVHNLMADKYMLGFAEERNHLSYRIDQTFEHVRDKVSNEDYDMALLTDENVQNMDQAERTRIANILGMTKTNPSVSHNKISLRFNDKYHTAYTHFNYSPSAWGNLTYFYTGDSKVKDAALLHEIQNDNIERLKQVKIETVDLDVAVGEYIKNLNTTVIANIKSIENNSYTVNTTSLSGESKIIASNHSIAHYIVHNSLNIPEEQGYNGLMQYLEESINLFKSDSVNNNVVTINKSLSDVYRVKNIITDIKSKGGLSSILTKAELTEIKSMIEYVNDTNNVPQEEDYNRLANDWENELGGQVTPLSATRKVKFKELSVKYNELINNRIKKIYGKNDVRIKLDSVLKPRTKTQIQAGLSTDEQPITTNLKTIFHYAEKRVLSNTDRNISIYKVNYIRARNAQAANIFNEKFSKLTREQYATIIENVKFNKNLAEKTVDILAQKALEEAKANDSSLSEDEKQMKILALAQGQEELIQEALDKKAELDEKYKNDVEEVDNTLEVELNYFTPLVHHLLQKHIKNVGKDFPLYFSGYNITMLTQGNAKTALIYAGKDEVNIVQRDGFVFGDHGYSTNESIKDVEGFDNTKDSYYKDEVEITKSEFDKVYQAATKLKAEEIKKEAAIRLNVASKNDTIQEAIKKLNEFKKQSSENMNRAVYEIMNINNNKPIETGAIYNAMSQIPGVKLIWQDSIKGIKKVQQYNGIGMDTVRKSPGGYLVDLTNYNFTSPVLYGISKPKVPTKTIEIQGKPSIEVETKNKCK